LDRRAGVTIQEENSLSRLEGKAAALEPLGHVFYFISLFTLLLIEDQLVQCTAPHNTNETAKSKA
jgi:hypothetical protein